MILDELPLLLTVDEAAHVMRLSRNGAYNAVADGAIPSIRIGRSIRIPRDALATALGLGADDEGTSDAGSTDRVFHASGAADA